MPATKRTKNQSISDIQDLDLQPGFEQLQIRYVLVSQALEWELDGNPKKHNLHKIADSILCNGFRDPPAFDASLNGGKGGLVFGNGRTEALGWMESQGRNPPRGIAVTVDGRWAMPILFGVDAKSEAAAKRFSLDHNLLTMAGGEFTALDMSRMFESEPYLEMLQELADINELPLMVDGDDLDLLLNPEGSDLDNGTEPSGVNDSGINYQSKYAVAVECINEVEQQAVYERLTSEGLKCKVLVL